MDIRQATASDLLSIQQCNLHNLPENYTLRYYLYHILTWPQLSYVAISTEDEGESKGKAKGKGKIVGYVLGKIDEDSKEKGELVGHVTSISILRNYRRLGLANKLMRLSQDSMREVFGASHVSLHVRQTNRAAISLYRDSLGFTVKEIEVGYYGDGEDAMSMRLEL